MGPPTVLFVVTEDWYFVSHRLPLARHLQRAGYRVVLAARFTTHLQALESEGIQCVPLRLRRRGASPVAELQAILELRGVYRTLAPAVIHHVALKPVVLGGAAAVGLRGPAVVNAIAGLGFLFSAPSWRARLGRMAVLLALRGLFARRASWVIVQTPEDERILARMGVGDSHRRVLIRGAGVDLATFQAAPQAPGVPVVLYAGRMLSSKGVPEFVQAAERLRGHGVRARFVLVGEPDPDNPASLTTSKLEEWHASGVVEWWGRRDDMPHVMTTAHIVCLPTTYGEGVPKVLLEAAACARPIVATDWPGCREVVIHDENGLLVPPRQVEVLAAGIRLLVEDPSLRTRFGAAGRKRVEQFFSLEAVAAQTQELYARALRADS